MCIYNFFLSNLFLTVLVFFAACGLSLVAVSRGYPLVAVCGLLTAAASLTVEHGL